MNVFFSVVFILFLIFINCVVYKFACIEEEIEKMNTKINQLIFDMKVTNLRIDDIIKNYINKKED
jgi:hypothetical protein